jgi:hypothetical protein
MKFFLFFIIISINLNAQFHACINFDALKLANQQFAIEKNLEPILGDKLIISKGKLDGQGKAQDIIEFQEKVLPIKVSLNAYEKEIYLQNADTFLLIYNNLNDQIEISNTNKLNKNIELINVACNDFFFKAAKKEGAPLPSKQTRYFCDSLKRNFIDTNDLYLKNYLKFKLAYVEISANARSRREAGKLYFNSNELHYDLPVWCDAFLSLYKNYFNQYLNSKKGLLLKQKMLEKADWQAIVKEFQNDSIVLTDELHKLIIIQGIDEQFQMKAPNKTYLLDLLESAIKIEKNKQLIYSAQTLFKHYSSFKIGKMLPDLTLIDARNNEKFNSTLIKNKAIYFCYYPTFNYLTQQEIIFLKGIYRKYESKIQFLVVVNTDEKLLEIALKNLLLPFPMATFNSSSETINQWIERKDVINYLLIDKTGKIYQSPAEGPETGVEAAFLGLINN